MKYVITIQVEYLNDLFHSEEAPDGAALVTQLQEDFDGILDNSKSKVVVTLIDEKEVVE